MIIWMICPPGNGEAVLTRILEWFDSCTCTAVTAVSLETLTEAPIYTGETVDFQALLTPTICTLPYHYSVAVDNTDIITDQEAVEMPLLFDYQFSEPGTHTVTVEIRNCNMGTAVADSVSVTVLEEEIIWRIYFPTVYR